MDNRRAKAEAAWRGCPANLPLRFIPPIAILPAVRKQVPFHPSICLWAPPGCAARTVELCRDAGVTLTPAGAPFPGGHDPDDSVIRIAPTMPPLEELGLAMRLLPVAVRLAAAEKGLL